MVHKIVIFLFVVLNIVMAQNIYTVNFVNIHTEKDTVLIIPVNNPTDHMMVIQQIRHANSAISVSLESNNIAPHESSNLQLEVFFEQNVDVHDLIVIETNVMNLVYDVQFNAIFGDLYDSFTRNLWDENLKASLKNYVENHFSLGYSTARDSMFSIVDNYNDSIECVYTGRKIFLDHNSSTPRTDAYNQYINTEHTFPQGLFGKNEPMKSDLYHLYPTDVDANSKRGSYPFGSVVSQITYQNGGSKLGNDAHGNIVFEPRDVHKGNVARSMFYFVVCYQNYDNFLDSQESVLREWNRLDPVDQKEMNRNERIARMQGKRNPFIDHPQLVDRIINFSHTQNRVWQPNVWFYPDTLIVETLDTFYVYLYNTSPGNMHINSVQHDGGNAIQILSYSANANAGEVIAIPILVHTFADWHQIHLNISTNDNDEPNKEIVLSKSITSISKNLPITTNFRIEKLYPNPFNPTLQVQLVASTSKEFQILVVNSLGEVVKKLYHSSAKGGRTNFSLDFSGLPGGIYFLQFQSEKQLITKKVIYLK